jgi:hypothetical protein
LAFIDKPTSALGQQRDQPIPVVAAADLDEHRRVPSVNARLARVDAIAKAEVIAKAESSAK